MNNNNLNNNPENNWQTYSNNQQTNYNNKPTPGKKNGLIIGICIIIIILIIVIYLGITYFVIPILHMSNIDKDTVNKYLDIHDTILDDLSVEKDELRFNDYEPANEQQLTISSYNELLNTVYKHALDKNCNLEISYTGKDFKKIEKKFEQIDYEGNDFPAYNTEFEKELFLIDDNNTTDDADYLRGSTATCSIYATENESGQSLDISILIQFNEEKGERKLVNCYIKQLIKELDLNSISSNEEKISLVHDYIVTIINYDKTSSSEDFDFAEHSAFAGLFAGTSVCSSYALINYKILTELGIPCKYVTSNTHAWNLVLLDNKWYHLDLTWDDNDNFTTRAYYLKGDSNWELQPDHKTEDFYKSKEFLGNYPLSKEDYK